MKRLLGLPSDKVSGKQKVVTWLGWSLMLISAAGHVWHKYFTATGASRFEAFREYASHHWYFWLGFLFGAVLLWLGSSWDFGGTETGKKMWAKR